MYDPAANGASMHFIYLWGKPSELHEALFPHTYIIKVFKNVHLHIFDKRNISDSS